MYTRKLAITSKMAPMKFLVDLRVLGFTWYDSLELPHADTALYLLEAQFIKHSNKAKTRAEIFFPALDEKLSNLDYSWFELNATRVLIPEDAILVDEQFLIEHPKVLGNSSARQKELERTYSPVLAGTPANRRGIFNKNQEETLVQSKSNVVKPRDHRRIQVDDHVPTVRDGNEVDHNRRLTSRSSTIPDSESSQQTLVAPLSSRRYQRDIPAVNTGSRMILRRLNKN